MLSYADEATADDMLKLYDPAHLARIEMNLGIGLLVKRAQNFAFSESRVVDQRIAQTRRLCKESTGR